MPHLILEYTDNCLHANDFKSLFRQCHDVLQTIGDIKMDNCKSRAVSLHDYFIADGNLHHSFAHLSVRFIEGRSSPVWQDIGMKCLALLQQYFSQSIERQNLQLTVEVGDIVLNHYHKFPQGTLTKQ